MVKVLGVHGIGQYKYHRAPELLSHKWRDALGSALSSPVDFTLAYYSPLLHSVSPQGPPTLTDLTPTEEALLGAWLKSMGLSDAVAQGPFTSWLRDGVDWLVRDGRLGSTSRVLVRAALAEVGEYISSTRSGSRVKVQQLVADLIRVEKPQIVIAHSLGSVVAYESLWRNPDLQVPLLVTVGSPLALHGVFYDLFDPSVARSHHRPPGVSKWVNFADVGDPVAVPKNLSRYFVGLDADQTVRVHEVRCHTIVDYLSCAPVVRALRSEVKM